jgi:DNA topoisomerase-1
MVEAQAVIKSRFGEKYGTGKGRTFKTKAKGAQEAHESIRPTSFKRDPDSMRAHLKADELKLYRLIWQRAIASQMAPKDLETTTVELTAGTYRLRASATRTLFDGFARVYTEGQDDAAEEAERSLPPLREGDVTSVESVTPAQHFTEPPPRYTEATLIKALEENGIGRPSTYAATISTIVDRGYVRVEQRRLYPEEIGDIVTDYLVEHFAEYVDLAFTARMEEGLDEVASGTREWVPLLRDFFGPLKELVDLTGKIPPKTEPTDEVCSEGHPMVIRMGRNGKFLACSTYPDHKETRPIPGEEAPKLEGDGDPCPQCGEGVLATKRGRFGAFVGCSRYPDCTYIRKDGPPPPDQLPFEVPCPKSGDGRLVARRARRTGNVFWGCSAYPKCDFTTNYEPTGAVHDVHEDGAGPVARKGDGGLCLACGSAVELPEGTLVGLRLAGGPADPSALAKPARRGGARSGAPRAAGSTRRTTGAPAATPRAGGGTRRTTRP